MNCKNCGTIVQGNYCSHCGQSSTVGKITVASLLNELSDSIFQINRGFFYTFKALLTRPGHSIKEYLTGRRKKYYKPITYVLALSTIYFLTTQITGQNTWMGDLVTGFSNRAIETGKGAAIPPVLTWFSKNFAYTTLLLLPVFSLASYLAFRGLGRNYLEHFVINSYTTGQQAIFYALFALINTVVDSKIIESFPIVVAVAYAFWVFWQFFEKENRIVNVLRSILMYALYLIFSFGLFIAIMGIAEIVN